MSLTSCRHLALELGDTNYDAATQRISNEAGGKAGWTGLNLETTIPPLATRHPLVERRRSGVV